MEIKEVEWGRLLDEALTVPGSLTDVYSRFYNYSLTNCMLLRLQGVNEPVATYRRWQELERQVKKGSRAKAIIRPIMGKATDEDGNEAMRLRGFKLVRCIFGLSETEGEPLPDVQPRTWSREKALGKLAITEVPFDMLDGNVLGFSYDRNLAVSPLAPYPLKTTLHEMGHIVAGHTTEREHAEYAGHRGVKEFEAEGTAYLAMNELGVAEQMDAAESRAYVQHWLMGQRPDDSSIRRVFTTADAILRAGWQEPAELSTGM